MELSAKPTLMVGLAVIVVLTLVRRCWRQGCAALGVVILTTGGKEVLKSTILPRPDLVGAPENLLDQGFPSGHTAIPAALTLAAVLVVSPRIRPYVATAGVLWLACIAAASATMGGHRPSEVLGATLLACACYGLATWLLPPAAAPGATRSPRALPVITLTLALGRRPRFRRTERHPHKVTGLRGDGLHMCGPGLVRRSRAARTHRTPHTPRTGLTTRPAPGGNRRILASGGPTPPPSRRSRRRPSGDALPPGVSSRSPVNRRVSPGAATGRPE